MIIVKRLILITFCLAAFYELSTLGFTAENAITMFNSHLDAFYQETNGKAWFKESTDGGKVSFWMRAEQLEMVLDAFERTTNSQYLSIFTNLFLGFIADHGRTWEKNEYNDDIMWMVIACTRAYLLSKNSEFLDVGRTNFDLCYARAFSKDLGGGLWWKTDNKSKNACVNGPAVIAAYLLGTATGQKKYYDIATNLFLWERATLFDTNTGKVFDHIKINGSLAAFALTYNQGTFIGAANYLGFTNEAHLAAIFTMEKLSPSGFFPKSGERGDGGGFNGIAARWIAKFVYERSLQKEFEPWLQKNADAAWKARRSTDNLCWCRWPDPTPEGTRYSWGCSSAVVLMLVVNPSE
jgi:predicted alpha-1,6-mannanase (GH76 family)